MTRAPDPESDPELTRKLKVISECELLGDVGVRELRHLAHAAVLLSVNRGTMLLTPGQTAEALYVLSRGRVTLHRLTEDGRRVILAIIEPGGAFDEVSLLSPGGTALFAEAAEDSVVCTVPRGAVEWLLTHRPEVRIRLIEATARRLDELQQRLTEVAYTPVPARMAATLLRLSRGGERAISLPHSDIASIVCTYRETATRVLNEMRVAGLLELGRGRILVVDPDGLTAMESERP